MPGRVAIQWTRHTPHHWQTDVAGQKIDCWPTKRKWRFKGTTFTEHDGQRLDKAILDRLATMGEPLPAIKRRRKKPSKKSALCHKCKHWSRGLGRAVRHLQPWGYCNNNPPPEGDEILITGEHDSCSNFEVIF